MFLRSRTGHICTADINGARDKEFPKGLIDLKNQFSTKLEWNTLFAVVVQDTLCLAWQDNNIVLALSNIHSVDKAEDFWEKVRKRPAKTSTNG